MYLYLNDDLNHDKLSDMTIPELKELCSELRKCIFNTVMKNGGHLSSNLGTVELAVAIHRVFDVFGGDKVVWDVGHQGYAHKLLTGRFGSFGTLRLKGGISGFMRRTESETDAFISGHSSVSVSAAFGISEAMRLKGERGSVAAVIGDGALTGGEAYEGLNNAGKAAKNLTLIVNDNAMSISRSTGALARYLAQIRSTRRYYVAKERFKSALSSVPLVGRRLERFIADVKVLVKEAMYDQSNLFENLGFYYIGPVDGHNLEDMIEALSVAKLMDQPCVVHVFTRKGMGYRPAMINPGEYHAVGADGAVEEFSDYPPDHKPESFSEAFGRELEHLGKTDGRICAVTAAMKYAVGLNYFKDSCPSRFYDSGIAEQHSITFAAGLASEGMIPVFAVYSTFLQRGFDQLVHDCAIENTHIVLCVDRAGFVGADGETHQGIFDLPMLRAVPNTAVYSPASYAELRLCLSAALYDTEGIACVRYPKGGEMAITDERLSEACVDFRYTGKNHKVLGITFGRCSTFLAKAAERAGADALRLVKVVPLPAEVYDIAVGYERIVFFEESSLRGGIAEGFAAELLRRGYHGQYEMVGVDGEFIQQASVEQQLAMYGLDEASIISKLGGVGNVEIFR